MSLQSSSVRGPRRARSSSCSMSVIFSSATAIILYLAQQFSKPFPHRISQHFFNRTVWPFTVRSLTPTSRATQSNPVRCSIADPARSLRINERFHKVNRMSVDPLPITRQHQRHPTQNVGGQMRNLNPWRDQKPCVVGNETNIAAPGVRRPSDETIAWPQMSWRRRPGQTRDDAPRSMHQILQMLTDRLCIPQKVIVFEKTIEQWFLRRAPHQTKRQRPDRAHIRRQWYRIG